jgi:hypothetical protein
VPKVASLTESAQGRNRRQPPPHLVGVSAAAASPLGRRTNDPVFIDRRRAASLGGSVARLLRRHQLIAASAPISK